jgi:AcrR family transcriptional regulator
MTLFWEHGYDATSIAMLTATMGITPSSLYAAFGDKRRLFATALDRYLHTHGAFAATAIREEPTARRAVERLLREAATAYATPGRPPGCLLITAATNCSPESAEVQRWLRDLRAAGTTALEHKVEADMLAGDPPPGTDARALAAFVSATLQGMSAQARDGATSADLKQIAETALHAWPAPN